MVIHHVVPKIVPTTLLVQMQEQERSINKFPTLSKRAAAEHNKFEDTSCAMLSPTSPCELLSEPVKPKPDSTVDLKVPRASA